VEAIAKMTNFWKLSTAKEGLVKWEGEKGDCRLVFYRTTTVQLPVGQKVFEYRLDGGVSDVVGKHSSVAAALKEVGLSSEQFDFYRVLMTSAFATSEDWYSKEMSEADKKPTSIEATNIAFINAHRDLFHAYTAAYNGRIDKICHVGQWQNSKEQ